MDELEEHEITTWRGTSLNIVMCHVKFSVLFVLSIICVCSRLA
jgi:hypothetical protein